MEFWEGLYKHFLKGREDLAGDDFWERLATNLLEGGDFYGAMLNGLYHGFFVGPTGMGKSKLIVALVQHLMTREDRPTIFLLDPGGSTAREIEYWAIANGFREEVVILDPSEERFVLGYNPLACVPGMELSLQAKFTQEAIYRALRLDQRGSESIYYAPMVKQLLYYLVHLLMETNYTFEEATYLLANEPTKQAAVIIEKSGTEKVKEFWLDLQRLKASERQKILGLLQAELLSFITSRPLLLMMGQRERALDFGEFIESGKLFIANVEAGGRLTSMDAKLLTNFLINSVVRACFARPAYSGREVYLILEEAGEIEFTSDIGTILRRARKQGLKMIILNQDLMSIWETNPRIFSMLWTNTNHKVAFGDLAVRDLEILAPEFFSEELDLREIKDEIETFYFEPKETRREIFHSGSVESFSDFSGESEVESYGEVFGPEMVAFSLQRGSAFGKVAGEGSGLAEISGRTLVPFYEYSKQKQVTSRQFWSLEEQIQRCIVKLKRLERGQIALKRRGERVKILKVPYVPDVPVPRDYSQARMEIFKRLGCYATLEEIEAERERRQRELEGEIVVNS